MNDLLTTKATLAESVRRQVTAGGAQIDHPAELVPTVIGGAINKANSDSVYAAAMKARPIANFAQSVRMTGKYGTPYDVPRKWSDGATMTVRDRIASGKLSIPSDPKMSTNTLLPDWQNLWEAVRLDISIRKMEKPTVRQFLYNEIQAPNASRTMNISELFPFGVVFDENNGEGQAVPQGETIGGQYGTVDINIYAAGFTWTLLAELFDESMDMGRLSEAVATGYNGKRDDIAIDPITAYAYGSAGTAKHTAAATLAGANRQELLYLTIEDAIDDLASRTDPVTGRKISATDLVVLASEYDARHISRVAQGLPSVNERSYPALSEISRVIGYDGETINLRDRTVTYDGITSGTAYIVKRNRYMVIPVKRNLQVEVDPMPDVRTLARQERAYWFAEGVYHGGDDGIGSFVQKITLPTW
jgi:hypothetical protein